MTKNFSYALLALFALFPGICNCEDMEIALRIIDRPNEEDSVLNKSNLNKIKEYIIKKGKRETYCNMYNNNPTFHTTLYSFYLNPDSGPSNINCDLKISDFNNMTIRMNNAKDMRNQSRHIKFIEKGLITVSAPWPSEELTVKQIKTFAIDALADILKTIDADK